MLLSQNTGKETRTGFDRNEVGLLQLLASNGVCTVLGDVFDDKATLIDVS